MLPRQGIGPGLLSATASERAGLVLPITFLWGSELSSTTCGEVEEGHHTPLPHHVTSRQTSGTATPPMLLSTRMTLLYPHTRISSAMLCRCGTVLELWSAVIGDGQGWLPLAHDARGSIPEF